LIRLHATVLDTKGQPVTDLTANDFNIVDDGKPQTLYFFGKSGRAAEVASTSEFANRKNGRIGNTVAVLFDLMNQNQEHRVESWRALAKSLPPLAPGDSLYFYLLNMQGELVPIHAVGDAEPVLEKAVKAASHGKQVQLGPEDQVKKTFHQLEVLAASLAAFPGRRNILWLTDGMQVVYNPKIPCSGDWVDCGLYVPHLAVALAQANVAVNVVSYNQDISMAAHADPGSWEDKWRPAPIADTHGNEMQDLAHANSVSAQGGAPAADGRGNPARTRGSDAALQLAQMAFLTGGGIYFGQDIPAAIERIVTRDANAFEIAYVPSAANWDNKFHRVRVTCKRPKVTVQSRVRYYALPDSRPPLDRMRAALVTALQSPTDNSDIGLRVKSSRLAVGHGVHLDIRVHLPDILLHEGEGKFKGSFYLLISDRGASGPLGEPAVLDLNPALTADQHAQAMKDGLPFAQDHPITEAVREVRVIVLDQNTNMVGSITLPAT
jgi:VWFA-related protein